MTTTLHVSKIFIIHYKKLIDRKNFLTDYFNQNDITNFEFREHYQRENLTKEIKEKYFKFDYLNSSQVCITIEHIETFKEIVKISENDTDWYLILEDDAVFCNDFVNQLNKYLQNVPGDAEYLDISDYVTISSPEMWVRNMHTRTNCAYLISKKTCEKLLTSIIPFENPIDHELNKQFRIHDIKTYWSNNSLIHHGSGTNYRPSYTQNSNYVPNY